MTTLASRAALDANNLNFAVPSEMISAAVQKMKEDGPRPFELGAGLSENYSRRGVGKSVKRDYAGAMRDFEQALRIDPRNVEAHHNMGVCRLKTEDRNGAIESFRAALELQPDLADAKKALGLLLTERALELFDTDKARAVKDCEEAIRIGGAFSCTYVLRGKARAHAGDEKAAVLDFTEAIRLDPQDSIAFRERALRRYRLRDYRGAVMDCDRAVAINPACADAYRIRGVARADLGDLEGASLDLDRAKALRGGK
jgi:tetratricopeptide (TPR) repeat protein